MRSRHSLLLKAVALTVACFLFANNTAYSLTSPPDNLAPESRLQPFFDHHGLGFRYLSSVIYAAGELRDLIDKGLARAGNISRLTQRLNREWFPDGEIVIEISDQPHTLSSGKKYHSAIFHITKENKKLEARFTEKNDTLTTEDLAELGVMTDEDREYFDSSRYSPIERVWFAVDKSRDSSLNIRGTSLEMKEIRDPEEVGRRIGLLTKSMQDVNAPPAIGRVKFSQSLCVETCRVFSSGNLEITAFRVIKRADDHGTFTLPPLPQQHVFVISGTGKDRPVIGHGIIDLNPENVRDAWFRFAIHGGPFSKVEFRGQGYGTEALALIQSMCTEGHLLGEAPETFTIYSGKDEVEFHPDPTEIRDSWKFLENRGYRQEEDDVHILWRLEAKRPPDHAGSFEPAEAPIFREAIEAGAIHRENINATVRVDKNTIIVYVISEDIIPANQARMVQNLERMTRGKEYPEKILFMPSSGIEGPEDFRAALEKAKQRIESRYTGYDIEFSVACPGGETVAAVQSLGMEALAFARQNGRNTRSVIQVEGIILALRTLRSRDPSALVRVYERLTGNKWEGNESTISELARILLFTLPAAEIKTRDLQRINDLIQTNILNAA